ncbi:hypothetical protein CCP1ISM_140021 [Azospirillaceae bacterium]
MQDSQSDTQITRIKTIDVSTLEGKPVPEREWLIEGWLPWGCTTIAYGDGGTGKSLLAQQLMTCVTAGRPFLGMPVRRCKSYGFFCEDDEGELHRRQAAINLKLNLSFSDNDGMYYVSRVADDNIIVRYEAGGEGHLTPVYEQLSNELRALGVQFVVIDTAADTFGGNEIARPQVRNFITMLTRLAKAIDGVVLLLAHPSQSGMTTGVGAGGSTAWSNSVRSRLYLDRPEQEAGVASDKNLRVLTRKKSNYAEIGDAITIKYVDGCFEAENEYLRDDLVSRIERVSRAKQAEDIFLSALDRLTEQKRNCTSNDRQNHYAPKIMKTISVTDGFKIKELTDAMYRLLDRDTIRLEEYKDKGRVYHRLVRARQGGENAPCA